MAIVKITPMSKPTKILAKVDMDSLFSFLNFGALKLLQQRKYPFSEIDYFFVLQKLRSMHLDFSKVKRKQAAKLITKKEKERDLHYGFL